MIVLINTPYFKESTMSNETRLTLFLSFAIAALATIASVGGLWLEGLYHDNLFVTSAWKGNDAITLFVAIPILIVAMRLSVLGSTRAMLVWLGVLDYFLYNYAFYLFGAAFNWFFLIYVALLGLSIFALIFGLVGLDVSGIATLVSPRFPVRWIAGYMLFVAAGLTFIYVAQSVGFIFTGVLPSIVTQSGHPTSLVFALDLTLLVPFLVLGAFWLLRRKPWGYVLAGMTTVKGTLYTLVLSAGSFEASRAGIPDVAGQIPLWIGLTLMGGMACGLLYTRIGRKQLA